MINKGHKTGKFLSIILVIVVVVFTNSCKTAIKSSKIKPVTEIPDICNPIKFTELPYTEINSDYYQVDSVFITNNCLNIWVSYSGGCGDAEFILYYNNLIMESMPPKANLMLKFEDKDECRALVQQKLYFDLSFFDNYAENDGIIIRLAGIGKPVQYKK